MDSLFWLLLNLLTIATLGFFSMEEMAIVSFNKIRLQIYLNQGSRPARWIDSLLSHPSRLFGTTLIGVNVSMMLGSEFAREFHSSLGIDPDWAPLSQVLLVIIFGELAPQFAARRYPEQVAFLGAPLLYLCSKLMAPLIWVLGIISKAANALMGGKESHHDLFLTLDELQRVLEDNEEERPSGKSEDLDTIVSNIFRLRGLTAAKVMMPMHEVFAQPANTSVAALRRHLTQQHLSWIPIYLQTKEQIVGIVFISDLIRVGEAKRIQNYADSPWFITENTPVLQVLKEFKINKKICACVIDKNGHAKGILSLDNILNYIFGSLSLFKPAKVIIDVTVPGEMTLAAFQKEFGIPLAEKGCDTLSDLFIKKFEQHPEEGDTLSYPPFDLTVKESSLREVKKVLVKTRQ